MKTLNLIGRSLFVLALAISLTQCEKDEDVLPKNNSVKMDGQSFAVVSATMLGVSIEDDGHTAISLISGNDSESNVLTIDVQSFTQATIEGDYAYPEVSDKKTLDNWLTSYTAFVGSSVTSANLESGDVSVIHNGKNNYTVTLDLIMDNGVSFTGSYSGDFQVMFYNE